MGGAGGRRVVGVGVVGGSGGVTSPAEEFRACVSVFLDFDQYPPGSPWLSPWSGGNLQLLRGHSLASQTASCVLGFPSGSSLLA